MDDSTEDVQSPQVKIKRLAWVDEYEAVQKAMALSFDSTVEEDIEFGYDMQWWRETTTFFAKVDGKVVGFIAFKPKPQRAKYIELVGVIPSFRKQGIASMLVKHVTDLADSKRWRLELHVEESNNAAIRLYENNGFKNMGIADDMDHDTPLYFMVRKAAPKAPEIGDYICAACFSKTSLCDPTTRVAFCNNPCRHKHMHQHKGRHTKTAV